MVLFPSEALKSKDNFQSTCGKDTLEPFASYTSARRTRGLWCMTSSQDEDDGFHSVTTLDRAASIGLLPFASSGKMSNRAPAEPLSQDALTPDP